MCSSEGPVEQDGTQGNLFTESFRSGPREEQDLKPVWTLSGTTMKAYVAMRGFPAIKDPLVTWIANLEFGKRAEGTATMLGDIENSFKERFDWKSRGPATYDDEEAQRKSTFIFDRPIVTDFSLAHLELSEGFDAGGEDSIFRDSNFIAEGWRNYAASDVSDDGEGDPADGRISPGTFALWSEGTKRWDEHGDKYRPAWKEAKTNVIPDRRQRPCSPNTALPRKMKHRHTKNLYDVEDGKKLSPACSAYAKTEPSILWSPPPMDPSLPHDFYNHMFDRMDPELMRLVRMNNTSTEPSWGVKTASEPERYEPAEVDAAIEKYWGLEATRHILASRNAEVAQLVQTEELANAEAEKLRHEATRLKHENRKLADCFGEHRSARDRRIMKQVQRQIRELNYVAKAKMAEIRARVRDRDDLARDIEEQREVQRRLLLLMGKDTPEEVFAMYPDIWEPEEIRKNRRNYS
ncbi:hypothetical protein DHEL01_v204793 [Diaporthe helianthi]|uniref:Uncharacterized protein n=1 Tax=Diaporthe helianthi TaxID=158607 RepID=A0A2P5I2S5_DIAHE|nr:hypothetical protein DHEL01_v204793 [Diaporthe helianthi]